MIGVIVKWFWSCERLAWLEMHPVSASADACESRDPWHERAIGKSGNHDPWTPAFAGVYGEGGDGLFEYIRAQVIHITRRIEPRRDIVSRKVARHAFKVWHPGAAIAVDHHKSLPTGFSRPSIHAP